MQRSRPSTIARSLIWKLLLSTGQTSFSNLIPFCALEEKLPHDGEYGQLQDMKLVFDPLAYCFPPVDILRLWARRRTS